MTSRAHLIEGLRQEIQRIERRPSVREGTVRTGCDALDMLLPGGGFPRGELTQVAGEQGSGKTALALSALAVATGLGAYVDGRGELYPPGVRTLGVSLERLLIVRPARGRSEQESTVVACWAAEALLASGAFETVVLDVPVEAARAASAAMDGILRRLRAAARKGGVAGIWLGRPRDPRIPGALRLEVEAGAEAPRVRVGSGSSAAWSGSSGAGARPVPRGAPRVA